MAIYKYSSFPFLSLLFLLVSTRSTVPSRLCWRGSAGTMRYHGACMLGGQLVKMAAARLVCRPVTCRATLQSYQRCSTTAAT